MKKSKHQFSSKKVSYLFDADFSYLEKIVPKKQAIVITDENIFVAHKKKFKGWNCMVLSPGEEYKVQSTVDSIIDHLIEIEADRSSFLIGVGGGVITDLVGYTASVYMRGIKFGFVPTSLLAMVDASIGGKNGIDIGLYKNMVGTVNQPEFLFYDVGFLKTLPVKEWTNGFAEVIKHACIKDNSMFRELEKNNLQFYMKNHSPLNRLIRKNALLKTGIVQKDEFENGERRLLNFGHTIGHAIENLYELRHGEAISVGMVEACRISEKLTGFDATPKVISVLNKFGLPSASNFDKRKVLGVLRMDKKRTGGEIKFVLLNKIGQGVIKPLPLRKFEDYVFNFKQ